MAEELNDGLTDAEREAMNSKDDIIDDGDAEALAKSRADAEAAAAAEAEAAKKAEEEAKAKAKADAELAAGGDEEAKAAAEKAAAEAAAKQAEEEAAKKQAPPEQSAPVLVVQPVEDADVKLKAISEKKNELLTKFDDGDITAKEYQQQLDSLAKEERQIEWQVEKAKLAGELEQQRQANEWQSTVNRFIAQNDRYDPKASPRMYAMLDLEVRAVAVSDEFKNRNDAAAGIEILQRAHENLAKELGFSVEKAPVQKQPEQKKEIKHAPTEPSLHKLPAADQADVAGGKYAALDRLAQSDPMAYEEALMKMPEAERNAYLATA